MPGCVKQPTYAPRGATAVHCAAHRRAGDIDVMHKLCRRPGCKMRPTFCKTGSRIPVHCKAHRGDDDVAVRFRAAMLPDEVRGRRRRSTPSTAPTATPSPTPTPSEMHGDAPQDEAPHEDAPHNGAPAPVFEFDLGFPVAPGVYAGGVFGECCLWCLGEARPCSCSDMA